MEEKADAEKKCGYLDWKNQKSNQDGINLVKQLTLIEIVVKNW